MADMNYVSPLTSDLTDYYTKSEVDELQQGDAATYATSAEIVAGDNAVKGWVVSQGFLTEHQDLTNYATISYVDDAIAAIEPSSGGMAVRVVSTLPGVGEENVLYLVFVDNEDEDNRYAEYVWVDALNDYEMLGYGTGEGVMPDLTNYATKSYVDDAIQHAVDFYPTAANELTYDNSSSGLIATDIQGAIDEIWDNAVIAPDLATIATSGDYEDLSNKPTIPSLTGYATEAYVNNAVGAVVVPDISGLATEQYVDEAVAAIDIPDVSGFVESSDLAAVATTGSYNDLTNKPAIPTVPANVSAFTNDAGYLTAHQDISGKANTADLATVAFSGDYDDLANKPSIPSTSGLASESYVDAAIAAITVPTKTSDLTNDSDFITSADLSTKVDNSDFNDFQANLSTVATTGDYDDLINKPTIPAAPDLTPYATKQELTAKADSASLATVATSGDYDDLTNKPTIPVLPTLATVATSGSYNDLSDKPTIPTYDVKVRSHFPMFISEGDAYSNNITNFISALKIGGIVQGSGTINFQNDLGEERLYVVELTSNNTYNNYPGSNPYTSFTFPSNSYALYKPSGGSGRGQIIFSRNAAYIHQWIFNMAGIYSNTTSGLTATTIQGAIDELAASSGGASTAAQLSYDNTNTWNDGTDTDTVQEAIDSLWNDVDSMVNDIDGVSQRVDDVETSIAALPSGYQLLQTYNVDTKTLTLSVVESSGR